MPVVVHQGGEGPGNRGDVVHLLHVEETQLQIAPAGTHGREQRGQVGVDTARGRRPGHRPRSRRRRRRGHRAAAGRRRPSGSGQPTARWPGASPGAGAPGERRRNERPGQVQQSPLLEPDRARPPVQADLGRRRTPHHPASAGRARWSRSGAAWRGSAARSAAAVRRRWDAGPPGSRRGARRGACAVDASAPPLRLRAGARGRSERRQRAGGSARPVTGLEGDVI